MMKPSIGRIVHYQSFGTPNGEYASLARAAIVTELCSPTAECQSMVSLAILNPTGMFFTSKVKYSEDPTPGCWSWPPRTS